MKKAALLITVCLVAFCVAGYYVYEHFLLTNSITPWDLIPENTTAVYEPGNCQECMDPVKNSPVWEVINKAAFQGGMQDSLKNLFRFLTSPKAGSLASLHVTKKDDFDFVYYVPVQSKTEKDIFEGIFEDWKRKNRKHFSEREYNGIKIQELSFGKQIFSWALLNDIWVGSFTPFLVEDVIRVFGSDERSPFRRNLAGVYQMPHIARDAGNLYIHLPGLMNWISAFSRDIRNIEAFSNLGNSALLDIKADQEFIVLNGFTLNAPGSTSLLSIFNDQKPVSYDLKQFVSARTVMMSSYGISDGKKISERIAKYPERKLFEDTLRQLRNSIKFNPDKLYETINNEIGVCYLESGRQQLSKVLVVETLQPDVWLTELNRLSDRVSSDTVFYEHFAEYEIKEVSLFRLPEKLFWPLVTGFNHCYYTSTENAVIIGDNLEELKLFLEDIVRENTWGKSVAQNKFLDGTLLESNMGLFVNTPLAMNLLTESLNQRWRQFSYDNRQLLASMGMGAIQFSNLNESFYTNVLWQFREPELVTRKSNPLNSTLTSLNNGILSEPNVVLNHIEKNHEVIVQDSSFQLYLIASDGKVPWSLMVNGPVIGDIEQIDYFNNGKLQYFFATPGTLHLIDRLGNYVDPFPLTVAAREIEHVSVIDYDHSKKYRFLIAERSGKLWMYDKEGVNLEGWNPRSTGGSLFTNARHHRIRGRDYLIAITSDGKAYAFNRRGESLRGFPLDLDARPSGDYFVEMGNSVSDTYFVIVSKDGFRIKFTLEGKISGRETLIKTAIESQFSLVPDKHRRSYVMTRRDNKRVDILDSQGKDFISNEFTAMNAADVHCFDFGAGNFYYAITDRMQNLSFVYDARGNLITYPPIESYSINLKPSGLNQVNMYFTYGNTVTIKPLF